MNTSQYPAETRKHIKRFQRSPGYQVMKQQHTAEREKLETKLRDRNEIIERLKKKLVESGLNAADVDKLAA